MDCSSSKVSEFKDGRPGGHCLVCGWEGKVLPIKWMDQQQQERLSLETAERIERREKGELFYLRVFTESGKDLPEDTGFRISAALEPQAEYSPKDCQPYVLMELENRPADELLEELRALPGVLKITIF